MSYACEILADSVSATSDHRLTTFCVTFPRFILAEVNTHRMLSRNSASSRAIPIEKSIAAIEDDMFVPEAFGAAQKGMQADLNLEGYDAEHAGASWRSAGRDAIDYALDMQDYGVHKAWANRLLEPFKWHTAIITATEWSNFFALRIHKDAQPEFREIALMMQAEYMNSIPKLVMSGRWHTPLITDDDLLLTPADTTQYREVLKKISVGRCARVSAETHAGVRDRSADLMLCHRLLSSRHLSPFEHVARPFSLDEWELIRAIQARCDHWRFMHPGIKQHGEYLARQVECQGNLRGWHSARMDIPNEEDFGAVTDA